MEKDILKAKLRENLEEINGKLVNMKAQISGLKHVDTDLEQLLTQTEYMRDKLEEYMDEIDDNSSISDARLKTIEQNIFRSVSSFDNAFKKAGGILQTEMR